jgi:phosphomannomutase/phosphoglucomutase
LPFNDLDGLRMQFQDGWGLVRASNTQPALVLRFEAPTAPRLQEMQTIVETFLAEELATHGVGA